MSNHQGRTAGAAIEEEDDDIKGGGPGDTSATTGSSDISQLQSFPTLQTYQAVPSDSASYGSVNFWDDRYMK